MSDQSTPAPIEGVTAAPGPVCVGIDRCNSGDDAAPAVAGPLAVLDRIAVPSGGSLFTRSAAVGIVRPNATWRRGVSPSCTDRDDITDRIGVDRVMREPRYIAFRPQGCLTDWQEVPCP